MKQSAPKQMQVKEKQDFNHLGLSFVLCIQEQPALASSPPHHHHNPNGHHVLAFLPCQHTRAVSLFLFHFNLGVGFCYKCDAIFLHNWRRSSLRSSHHGCTVFCLILLSALCGLNVPRMSESCDRIRSGYAGFVHLMIIKDTQTKFSVKLPWCIQSMS